MWWGLEIRGVRCRKMNVLRRVGLDSGVRNPNSVFPLFVLRFCSCVGDIDVLEN